MMRAFKRQIDRLVLVVAQDANAGGRAEDEREDERELQAVGNRAVVAQKMLLDPGEAHQDAGDGGRDGDFDQKCGKLLLIKHGESMCSVRSYNRVDTRIVARVVPLSQRAQDILVRFQANKVAEADFPSRFGHFRILRL